MDFTLDQVLTITGRLDDGPGFDTPRERFRRFLNQRMTDLEPTRLFIQQCRETAGEQSRRALQDAVAFSGRLLGFETGFGRYQQDPGVTPIHGTWHSRHRLHVTLVVCTDQTPEIDLDAMSHDMAEGEPGTPCIGLLVLTAFYAGKSRLEETLSAGTHRNLRLISLSGLLRLFGMRADGRLTHDEVLQVLNPTVTLDAQLDVLDHVATAARRDAGSVTVVASLAESERHDRRYWVNAMRPDPFTPTERVVPSLIATRQILGINPAPGLEDRVRSGDAICVFIAGHGVVAHAQIAGILTDGSRMIRDSKRFAHVLRLSDVTVYDTPVVPNHELARKLDLALSDGAAVVTTAISRREFEFIAAHALSEAG